MPGPVSAEWQERLLDHHDYVWARLPFVVPMALAVARRRGDRYARAVASDLVTLHPIVLDHLAREERALAQHSARSIRDRLHADHLVVGKLLALLSEDAANVTARDCCTTERALFEELVQLDIHLRDQIAFEEQLLGAS